MILYDYKRGLTFKESQENLQAAFGESAPALATITYWYREFKRGQESLNDDPRPGRPSTAVTHENVIRVEWLIQENRNITHREIRAELKIGYRAVSTILHEHLKVRKVAKSGIPHSLTDEQKSRRVDWCKFMLEKFEGGTSQNVSYILTSDESWISWYDPLTKQQSTQWVFEEDELPTKVVRGRSVNKKMIAAFFRSSGPVAVIPLEDRRTVTIEWYCNVCLP
ncbi:histone-lysine N-methyltransferase SETMAR-like [Pectinophora gossypiella]|uniref:histone-lysine N-methyltransferase SETMAR-like n=1 Tax=Pectinophora gossypiella TaxID=13191 RepID=UPI00214E06CF|nr:histone-lysine N-methyltransferase SETMAR-like [Pectinophora gossypiella]